MKFFFRQTITALFIFMPFILPAQTGPGGIGTANGSSTLEYWIDANQNVTGNSPITGWADLSGNNVVNTINLGSPSLNNSFSNNQRSINFDGASRIVSNLSINSNTFPNLSIIALYRPRVDDAGAVFGEDNGNWDRFILDKGSANTILNSISSTGTGPLAVPSLFVAATPTITSIYYQEDVSNGTNIYTNGALVSTYTANHGPEASSLFTIGDIGQNGNFRFDGDIAEVIVYSQALNQAQNIIINNYLSAKYGLPLTDNDLYTADNPANGNYDHDMAGIGRVDAGNIHADAQGTSIVRILNPSNLDDNEFLMWGHDNGFLQSLETTDIPAALEARSSRIWRVNEVNTSGTSIDVGTVDIRFDLTGVNNFNALAGLRLLIDTNNDGSFADETPIAGATDLGGNVYQFSGVTGLVDGLRFTFGTTDIPLTTAPTGPGGIGATDGSSTLEYWIDANQNVTGSAPITGWADLSGNNVTNNITLGSPVLNTNFSNNQRSITFDGAARVESNLSINSSVFPNLSILAVYRPRVDDAGGVFGEDDVNWDRFIIDKGNVFAGLNTAIATGTGSVAIPSLFTPTVPTITSVVYQEDVANGTNVYTNGSLVSTFTSNYGPEASSLFTVGDIGQGGAVGNYPFDGDIAEIIIHGQALNQAQNIIINNYVSAKYELPLSDNDLYDEDDPANGHYDHEVAGIGRVDFNNIHDDAQGTSIVRISNPTNLDDDEFLIWGHNNGTLQAWETLDVPPTVLARMTRVWRASEVNTSGASVDVGAVDMHFDLTGLGTVTVTDIRLLIDTDNDGIFADETPITGAFDLGSNLYLFPSVTGLANNLRFTLATINPQQTPLPIDAMLLTAKTYDQQTTQLVWQTINEKDNNYFTIERSKDALTWETLGTIESKGDGDFSYNFKDQSPYKPTTYYKLKQTDYNGQSSYTAIQVVTFSVDDQALTIYPNPTTGYLIVRAANLITSTLQVYNQLGQEITTQVTILDANDTYIKLDLSKLPTGTYFMKLSDKMTKIIKE